MKSLKQKSSTMAVEAQDAYCPSMSLTDKQLPDLDGMSVGDTCEISFKAKITGVSKYRNGDTTYTLDMTHAEIDNDGEGEMENETE